MYFIITTLTTVGYGDISASTNAEIVVAIILMMGGVLGYSIAVGTVSTVLMQADQRQTVIANKMQTLAHFAKETDMDLKEYSKIKRHINQKYNSSLDWMEHLTGPAQLQSLLSDLPVVLRAKMLRHMHHGRHLKLEFFSRYRDDDLFAYMVPLLQSDHFCVHDMIYLRGDYAERVYFLTKGTVVFFIFERLEAKQDMRKSGTIHTMDLKEYHEIEQEMMTCEPFQIVVDGSTFGDFEVLLGIPRQQCVRCDIESECLRLHKKDLLRTLAEFPAIAECMRRDAKHEFHLTQKRKKQHAEDKGLSLNSHHEFDQYDPEGDDPLELSATFPSGTSPPKSPKLIPHPPEKEVETPLPPNGDHPGPTLRSDLHHDAEGEHGSSHHSPHLEDRLKKIERRQETLIARQEQHDVILKDVQSTLFSIDLRIQSLVLRN
jgi:CRP-like cAMP-binding protein